MKPSKKFIFFTLCCALLCCVSCYKGSFEASSIVAQPYVNASSGEMGLSVYFTGVVPSDDGITMSVISPDGVFSWTIGANKTIVDNVSYYGCSSFAMPKEALLPTGQWSLKLYYKDGRTLDYSFEVSYRDVEGALERSASYSESFFDETSNLTVLF